jgi:hypothetical protein
LDVPLFFFVFLKVGASSAAPQRVATMNYAGYIFQINSSGAVLEIFITINKSLPEPNAFALLALKFEVNSLLQVGNEEFNSGE